MSLIRSFVSTLAVALPLASQAAIVEGDVQPYIEGGQIKTGLISEDETTSTPNVRVFFAELGEDVPNFTGEPGWLAPDGTLKLTDFGAAAALDGSSLAARYGTPRYLPPERLADLAARGSIRTGDRRVDLWGIGVCMYELLTLRPAFDATTVADALRAVATMDPIQPRQVNWSVPPALESCCMRCLRRDPNERYPEASSLAADLSSYLAQPSATSALSSLGSLFKRFGQPGGRA